MLVNGTVLGVAPIKTSLLLVAAILSLLFTLVKPEASAGLGFWARLSFWVLHIGIGLMAILLASCCLRVWRLAQLPTMVSLGVTGIIGAVIAAPLYCLLEFLYPPELINDGLDEFGYQGWWQAILVEFLYAFPVMLISWYAVNLPFLLDKPTLLNESQPETPDDNPDELDGETQERQQRLEHLYQRLPEVLGRDIVAISSDLHYLNVHTTLGKILVLGSLKYYAEAFADAGMQVHRSNWVAKDHVVKVYVSGTEAYCLMTNGMKVPISRNKRKEVKNYFGQSVRHADAPAPRLTRIK
ncbi:MAG TPA: LytTR family DNA-binding domain-containing protein [Cellvibrio sp.]|nr:LytTR family DNA-binding domain-containing protein [Cellvibrio sp.]